MAALEDGDEDAVASALTSRTASAVERHWFTCVHLTAPPLVRPDCLNARPSSETTPRHPTPRASVGGRRRDVAEVVDALEDGHEVEGAILDDRVEAREAVAGDEGLERRGELGRGRREAVELERVVRVREPAGEGLTCDRTRRRPWNSVAGAEEEEGGGPAARRGAPRRDALSGALDRGAAVRARRGEEEAGRRRRRRPRRPPRPRRRPPRTRARAGRRRGRPGLGRDVAAGVTRDGAARTGGAKRAHAAGARSIARPKSVPSVASIPARSGRPRATSREWPRRDPRARKAVSGAIQRR